MTEVVVNEGADDGATEVAGQAAVVSGAALATAADAGAQAGEAQGDAAAARAEAQAARVEAEQARIEAMDAKEATGELAKILLMKERASQPQVESEPVVTTEVSTEEPPPVDEAPKSVEKKVQKKTLRDRWGG